MSLIACSTPQTRSAVQESITSSDDGSVDAVDITANIVIEQYPTCHGGFSDVYRGFYTSNRGLLTASKIAVKVLRVTEENEIARVVQHLKREVLVWNRVSHPLVARFHGVAFLTPHARPALVFDWYDKGQAKQYLQDKTLPQKLDVIRDVACAIVYLHSLNIVHGDIKGSNVLISDDGHPVVIDFGLSRIIGYTTGYTTSSMPGSIRWQAPELLQPTSSPKDRSKASDIWAFGCTVYELLSGTVPFASYQSTYTLVSSIIMGLNPLHVAELPPDIPHSIREILIDCWVMHPSCRPSIEDVAGRM